MKLWPVRSKDPGNPHDEMPVRRRLGQGGWIVRGKHILFAGAFRFAIDADRPRFIFFAIRLTLVARENVIGADVNQLCLFFAANLCQHPRRFRVDPKRFFTMRFAVIDVRQGRAVDDNIDIQRADLLAQLIGAR